MKELKALKKQIKKALKNSNDKSHKRDLKVQLAAVKTAIACKKANIKFHHSFMLPDGDIYRVALLNDFEGEDLTRLLKVVQNDLVEAYTWDNSQCGYRQVSHIIHDLSFEAVSSLKIKGDFEYTAPQWFEASKINSKSV